MTDRPLSVLHVLPYFNLFPPRSGGALRCFHILRELARYHETCAMLLQSQDELRGEVDGLFFPETVHVYSPVQTPPPHTPFDHLPRRLGHALQYRWVERSLRGSANSMVLQTHHLVRDILQKHVVDVAILENLDSGLLTPLIRRWSPRTVCVLDALNIDHVLYAADMQARPLSGRETKRRLKVYHAIREQETHLRRSADAFLACSDDDRDTLTGLNRQEIQGFTIPNGVETGRLPFDACAEKAQSQTIIFCGSLSWPPNRAGLEWFHKQVWPRLLQQRPGLRLIVIGRGAAPDDYAFLRRDPTVKLVGAVDSVLPFYREAGVAIVPLLTGSGTRLKILEAMSLGNPIVSTPIGAQGIRVNTEEHLLLADTPDAFAAAIGRLLTDHALFDRLRQAARALVEQTYDWQVIGKQLQQTLEAIMDCNKGDWSGDF